MRPSAVGVGLLIFGIVSAAALGAAGAAVFLAPSVPHSLSPGPTVSSVPLVERPFDDSRAVNVRLLTGAAGALLASGAGTLTRFDCESGGVINAGTAPVSINGLPVVAISTSVPLWRDINVGDSGADVLSLQNELLRLGISVVADGYFGWTDAQAVDLLFQGLGDADADFDGMPLGRSMWLPSAVVTPSSCDVAVGAQVGPGDTLATLPGTPTRAVVVNYPKDLLAGDRVLNVDGNVIPVNAEGTITDSPSLVILATLSAASATSDDAAAPVPGTLLLSSPVTVAVVPPTSVYNVEDAEGCVVADDRAIPVRVVGSQLGQTFVLFEGDAPKAVSTSPDGDLPCR